MPPVGARVRWVLVTLMQLTLFLLISGGVSAQQATVENIRPVGQVCLAGQPCVGIIADSAAAGSVEPAPEAAATIAQPANAQSEPVAQSESVTQSEPVAQAEPVAPAEPVAQVESEVAVFDAATTYQMSCFACHATGAAGAPELGDQEAWSVRMEKGMEAVMANVITGLNAMPPRGLCFDCSDDDLLALVEYMVKQ